MKRYAHLWVYLIVLLCFACAGGQPGPPLPEASADGMKELRKGIGWYQKGCYRKSLNNFLRAFEDFAVSDYLPGTAICMNNIGNVYRFIGDIESALLFFDASYGIYMDLDDSRGAVQALANKSAVLLKENRIEEAEAVIQQAEALQSTAGITSVPLLNNKGILFSKKKDYAAAENTFKQALQETTSDNFRMLATVNAAMGNLEMETGDHVQAVDYFKKALEADRTTGNQAGIADDLTAIGTAYYLQQDYASALNYLKRGVKIHAILSNTDQVSGSMAMMEKASEATGIDISVTRYFVEKWVAGELLSEPCR